jgi:hypothetical protein
VARRSQRWAPRTSVRRVRFWEAASGCLLPSQVIAVPVGGSPPVHHDGGAHCCLGARAGSAKDGGPKARRRVTRKADDVVVAILSAATAYLLSILIRPLVLVARMRVHIRMDPESAYHGLLGHGRDATSYDLRSPESRAPRSLLRRISAAPPGPAAWDVRAVWGHTGRRAARTQRSGEQCFVQVLADGVPHPRRASRSPHRRCHCR